MPEVNDVGEPCAGEPHARFDRGPLATTRTMRGLLVPGRCAGNATKRPGPGPQPRSPLIQVSGLPHPALFYAYLGGDNPTTQVTVNTAIHSHDHNHYDFHDVALGILQEPL